MCRNSTPLLRPAELQPQVRLANYHAIQVGADWSDRTIDDLELILAIQGHFEYLRPGRDTVIQQPGSILLILPGELHTYRHCGRPERAFFSCIHFELTTEATWASGRYRWEPAPRIVTDIRGGPDLPDLFRRAAIAFRGYGPLRAEIVSTIVREIWLRLSEKWRGPVPGRRRGRIGAMQRFLREHLSEHPGRSELAEEFGLTPQHVNYLFRRELGITPTQFVHRECALRASRLMRQEGLSVKEAASRLGFADPFHFSRIFRRAIGVPPSRI
jgi:AraC-like DNA-binding protein